MKKKGKDKWANKNIKYQSSSPWLVVCAMAIILFILGLCVYWDLEIDGILFNDTNLYVKWFGIILRFYCVIFVISIFLYVKIVIIDDVLVIYRMKFLFWVKPFRVKITNIKKVAFLAGMIPIITIHYKHDVYENAVCKKTFNYWGLERKKKIIIKFKEFGIAVHE